MFSSESFDDVSFDEGNAESLLLRSGFRMILRSLLRFLCGYGVGLLCRLERWEEEGGGVLSWVKIGLVYPDISNEES